jgi:serine/threonine kinase PknH
MITSPWTLSNPACLGAFEPIQAATYQGSNFSAVNGQNFRSTNPPKRVYQAAVGFPSTESAHAFVRASADSWNACAGQTVTVTDGSQTTPWIFAERNGAPPRIVQRHTQAIPDGRTCQHVLSAVSSVVIDVTACGTSITNEGGLIADQMATRVKP